MLLNVFCLFVSFLLQGKLQRFLYNLPKEMIKRLHRYDFTKIATYMCNTVGIGRSPLLAVNCLGSL